MYDSNKFLINESVVKTTMYLYHRGTDSYYCLNHRDSCPTPANYIKVPKHYVRDQLTNELIPYPFEELIKCKVCSSYDRQIISDKGIIAWRGWSLDFNTRNDDFKLKYRLRSISYDTTWEPKEKLIANLPSNGKYETAGIWSVLPEQFNKFNFLYYKFFLVIGEVYIWGKVIKHQLGYRSEFAYPKSFYIIQEKFYYDNMDKDKYHEILFSVQKDLEEYGVEVKIINSFNKPWEEKCK